MPVIDPQLVAILAVAACVAALVLLVVVVVLALRLRVVRRTLRRAFGSGDRKIDIVEMLDLQRAEVARLREETARLHTETRELREDRRGVVSRISLLRYDAFDDMGGALSFSAALLDDHRHGMVISAINGRSETRCYAKPVVDGRSEHTLSSEEDEAISAAIEGRPATAPTEGRGRRRAS